MHQHGIDEVVPLWQSKLSELQYQLSKGKQKLQHICVSTKPSVEYLNLQAKSKVNNSKKKKHPHKLQLIRGPQIVKW